MDKRSSGRITEMQIRHLELHQEEFDSFYTEHKPVREYCRQYSYIEDLYLDLCSALGITPLEGLYSVSPR